MDLANISGTQRCGAKRQRLYQRDTARRRLRVCEGYGGFRARRILGWTGLLFADGEGGHRRDAEDAEKRGRVHVSSLVLS